MFEIALLLKKACRNFHKHQILMAVWDRQH